MPTPLMSDEELDALARRSAEAYPDELPLGAWRQLQDRLDLAIQQRQVQRQVRRRVAQLFLLEIVLVGLLLLGGQNRQLLRRRWSAQAEPPPSSQLAVAPSPPATQHIASAARHASPLLPPAPAPTASTASLQPSATAQQPTISVAPSPILPRVASGYLPTRGAARLPLRLPYLAATRRHGPPRQANDLHYQSGNSLGGLQQALATVQPLVAGRSGFLAADTSARTLEPTASTGQTAEHAAAQDSGRTPPATPLLPTPGVAADSTGTHTLTAKPVYRLLLGVNVAPELAAVRPQQLAGPSLTAGLVAEYRLTPRWRVRSGVLYSVKRYEARGTDYRPPASYWTWRIPVDRIEADCRIVEIPLDVRYEVRLRPAYSLFASAGLSSLLMRNEQYTYDYTLNGQYLERTWSLARGGSHVLSVLNLSVGYERALGGRWAAQAEPFVKLPLGGVGFGRIHLRSAGVSLGLKYGLLAARP